MFMLHLTRNNSLSKCTTLERINFLYNLISREEETVQSVIRVRSENLTCTVHVSRELRSLGVPRPALRQDGWLLRN